MEVPMMMTHTNEKPKISVWLSNRHSDKIKFFYCSVCGHKLFGYYDEVRILLAGSGKFVKRSPIEIQCNGIIRTEDDKGYMKNIKCKTIYVIG